ncbi:hypothetical protein [Microcystis sp. LSC13-02]|nr:hypothetical protein [Microcystis sp. LSC13-02]
MKSKSTGHWSDRGGNSGTFSLKMGKTLQPTAYSLQPTAYTHQQTFCRKP